MSFIKRYWNFIKPSKEALLGATVAAILTVIWAGWIGALNLESGFGLWADFAFAAFVAVVGIALAALLIAFILWLIRRFPPLKTGFFLACAAFVSLIWFGFAGWQVAVILLFLECALGAALATITLGGLRSAHVAKRVITWSILLLTVAANIALITLFHQDGVNDEQIKIKEKQSQVAPVNAADPSKTGPYKVKTIYYGSGDSLRRSEFGRTVSIRTGTVDASLFFKDFTGWKAWIRKRYWGFGMDKLPLNARVFYPEGAGPFPLFLIVHGNHQMSVASDRGYDYLCELLASQGIIAASIDENFLNSGLFHDPPKQQAVRGWLLLEHLRLWNGWAKDAKNLFSGKVDLTRIALAGHSRGGEAAATAALFNHLEYFPDDANIKFHYGYQIKAVIAIAPPDGQYKPAEQWRLLKDVNYFTLQGANDADVSSFNGSRQYDHVSFSGTVSAFKSELYIYRANHGQFNTMWGKTDVDTPSNWFLNLRPLLSGDEQRQIAKVYIPAFLKATLLGQDKYKDLFRDYRRGASWMPASLYVNRFQDQSYKPIAAFNEDSDLTSTTMPGGHLSASGLTLWKEAKIPFRSGDRDYNGVFLGWNWDKEKKPPKNLPRYQIDLPSGDTAPALALSLAATDDAAPDPTSKPDPSAKKKHEEESTEEKNDVTNFTLEAVDAHGATSRIDLSSQILLLPPLHVQFTKIEWLDGKIYKNSAEPVFQSVHIPFQVFKRTNPQFNEGQVRRVTMVFDKTPSRVIIVSGIGFEDN